MGRSLLPLPPQGHHSGSKFVRVESSRVLCKSAVLYPFLLSKMLYGSLWVGCFG